MPHDQHARCVCGHIAGHHAVDAPWPCRLNCDCESFATKSDIEKRNKIMDNQEDA